MTSFEHIVINGDQILKLDASGLDELRSASDEHVTHMLLGIAAIGHALAVASSNDDSGFDTNVLVQLGWTIEAMAQMGNRFSNLALQAINEQDRRSRSAKRE
jgi:hypothetical protein